MKKTNDTNSENKTMNTPKWTFNPIRIRLTSSEWGFRHYFDIDFILRSKVSVREAVKYLIGLGYVSMAYNECLGRVLIFKRGVARLGRLPLTTVGLRRMMAYVHNPIR